jgi:outer membrane protein OmpA-like peptidoglycan-associated protein
MKNIFKKQSLQEDKPSAHDMGAPSPTSKGYGQNSPIPGLSPSDGRNRRVEIKLFRAK